MIHDTATRQDVARQWSVICKLCQESRRQYQIAGGIINETRPEDSYNLPFVLAYALLDQVLSEMCDQGLFLCSSWQLGAKMAASKAALAWLSYGDVEAGKTARNELAHEGKLVSKNDCLRYVRAVGLELHHWKII